MSQKSRLLGRTALPLVAVMGLGIAANPLALPVPELVSRAAAQSNPCAPSGVRRSVNPCAPANPRATGNPCAPARPAPANPCAARSPVTPAPPAAAANPCAAQAVTGDSANPFDTKAGHAEAPYGDKMPDIVSNYLRAAPYVGTGGVVRPGAFATLRDLGFRSVINLNSADEGAEEDGRAATEAGLGYANLPVTELAPLSGQVDRFSRHVNDPANYPVLVYCQSSNRVGAMWALYRARNGVPPEIAIQEGRTVGLKPSREAAVRDALGLPPQ